MTTVSTLSTNSTTYTYEELQAALANGTIDEDDVTDISIFSASTDSSECTDGEDDGKIGFFSAVGNMVKGAVSGVVNGVKGMFTDEDGNFSLLQTVKSAATIGACFIPGVGPVIAAALCAKGVVTGVTTVAQGVAAAASAETDAEAKAAFQSIGSGTLTTALSAYGLKASVSSVASTAGVENAASNSMLQNLRGIGKNVSESASTASTITGKIGSTFNTLTGNYYSSAWSASTSTSTLGKVADVAKQTAADTGTNIVAAAKAVKQKVQETTNKLTGKSGSGTADSIAKKLSTKDTTVDASQIKSGETIEVNGKTYKISGSGDNLSYELQKTTTTTKTYSAGETTSNVDISTESLSEADLAQVQSLKKGSSYTTSDGVTYKNTGDGITKTTSATKTTTKTLSSKQTQALENAANMDNAFGKIYKKLLNGETVTSGSTTMSYSNGTLTTTSNVSNASYTINKALSSINAGEYATYVTSTGETLSTVAAGQGTAAALALVSSSTADASSDIADSISDASTTYATVTTETGVEYELEDYSIMSEDELDESYASILSSVL